MGFGQEKVGVCLIVAAALLAGGCSTRIEPVPEPELVTPNAFSETGEGQVEDKWWLSFGDNELNGLMEKAFEGNFNLRGAYDRLLQAEASARIASADLYPALDATSGFSQNWTHDGQIGDTEGFRSYEAGLRASYEVDLWGRIRSLRNAELLEVGEAAEDLETAAITLSANVATTWYQLREQVSQIALLDEQIRILEETLSVLEGRFGRGLTSASDVLQQRQLVEARREERERALEERRRLELTLAALLGMAPPPPGTMAAAGGVPALPPLPDTGIPAEVVARRPDVTASYLAVQAADQRVASAIANQYPRLALSASAGSDEQHWQDLFDNWFVTLAANATAPIFDGGERRAEVARQRAVLRERFNDYGQTYLEALVEVERALNAEVWQRRIQESIEKQLELAREVITRITTEYLNGRSEYLRVLSAQQSVQSLERELLASQQQLVEARINLLRALSGGWQPLVYPAPLVIEEDNQSYPLPIPFKDGASE